MTDFYLSCLLNSHRNGNTLLLLITLLDLTSTKFVHSCVINGESWWVKRCQGGSRGVLGSQGESREIMGVKGNQGEPRGFNFVSLGQMRGVQSLKMQGRRWLVIIN